MKPAHYIGIDLGTSHFRVAVYSDKQPTVLKNRKGESATASVWQVKDTCVSVGSIDASQPGRCVSGVKRVIGKRLEDMDVQDQIKKWPFRIIDEGGSPKFEFSAGESVKYYCAEHFYSLMLKVVKAIIEARIGAGATEAAHVVLTVPAQFTNAQRELTMQVAANAGLNVVRMLNESTAAALFYGHKNHFAVNRNLLVFDLGGSRCDVSVISVKNEDLVVLATANSARVSGEDFDNRLLDRCLLELKPAYGRIARYNSQAGILLRTACERAKRKLDTERQVLVHVAKLFGEDDYSTTVTRSQFEELCDDLFRLCVDLVRQAISDAKLKLKDINDLLFVGGCSKIPKIQAMVKEYLQDVNVCDDIDADEAVVCGAAIEAARNTKTSDLCTITLRDVVGRSLGVGANPWHEDMWIVIPKDSCKPIKKSECFTTSKDNQSFIDVEVYEGEHANVQWNTFLGLLRLKDLPRGRAGSQKVQVTFEFDENGILSVTAQLLASDKSTSVKIQRLQEHDCEYASLAAEAERSFDELYKGVPESRRNELEKQRLRAARQLKRMASTCIHQAEDDPGLSAQQRKLIHVKAKQLIEWYELNRRKTERVYQSKLSEITSFFESVKNGNL